jgi:hypothetical protein
MTTVNYKSKLLQYFYNIGPISYKNFFAAIFTFKQ